MSLFQDGRYQWRETCFVLFDPSHRPTFEQLKSAISSIENLVLGVPVLDEQGRLESVSVQSTCETVAFDLCYLEGEEVVESLEDLLFDLKHGAIEPEQKDSLDRIARSTARLDVLHFQQVAQEDPFDDFEEEEDFDPGTLLLLLDVLSLLTSGVAVDPQSGVILSD